MLTTRWQPFSHMWSDMNRLQEDVNRLLGAVGMARERWPNLAVSFPALNVWEDEKTVFAEAELPGMSMEDLEIFVTGGNQLTIKGERKEPVVENGTWHRRERGFGTFARVITLPADVDANKVEAKFVHGVLTITMPKSEKARPRKITVKAE